MDGSAERGLPATSVDNSGTAVGLKDKTGKLQVTCYIPSIHSLFLGVSV